MAEQEFDNTNRGALFKNDRRTNERQPEYKGDINVEGTEYWVSAWVKTSKSGSKSGQKFFSLALTKKDARPAATVVEDDDVPF